MTVLRLRGNQRGFTLVGAVFILVVLAALGVVMVTLSGVQSRVPVFALNGARAYHVARSGLEWGSYLALNVGCGAANAGFTLENFALTVSCTNEASFTEAGSTFSVYRIEAYAAQGSYGSADFTSRRLEAKIVAGP